MTASRLRLLLPSLYFRHRGFFLVALGMAWVHLWFALDELLPHAEMRHSYKVWRLHDVLPASLWGILHVICFAALLVGMYSRRLDLFTVRLVAAFSASVFSVLSITFGLAAFEYWPVASLSGIGFTGLCILCSVAMVMEPPVNPASLVKPRRQNAPHSE